MSGRISNPTGAQIERMRRLKQENKRLKDALAMWEKFAYYAMGKSGHTPLTMNLWLATLFGAACEAMQEEQQ